MLKKPFLPKRQLFHSSPSVYPRIQIDTNSSQLKLRQFSLVDQPDPKQHHNGTRSAHISLNPSVVRLNVEWCRLQEQNELSDYFWNVTTSRERWLSPSSAPFLIIIEGSLHNCTGRRLEKWTVSEISWKKSCRSWSWKKFVGKGGLNAVRNLKNFGNPWYYESGKVLQKIVSQHRNGGVYIYYLYIT